MKFGKSLLRNQVPEWSSRYLNYKELKRLIKEVNQQRLNRVDLGTAAAVADPELRKPQLHPATEADLAQFFYALDRNLEAVEWFFQTRFSEYSRRLAHFNDRYPVATLKPYELDHEEVEDLIGLLLDIRSQLRKLQWYAETNKRGFVKILKKFDKKVETSTKTQYLDSKVLVLSFTNGAALDEKLALTNKYLSELTPYAAEKEGKTKKAEPLELSQSPQSGSSQSGSQGGLNVLAMRAAVLTDDSAALKTLIDDAGASNSIEDPEFNKALLSVLSKAVNSRAHKSIDIILWHLKSVNDPSDINGRNIFHRAVINQGRQLFGDVGRENRISHGNFIYPAEGRIDHSTPLDEVGESNPEDEIHNFADLLDRLSPRQRLSILSRDGQGRTPLHYSAFYGLKETTRALLDRMKRWGFIFGEANFDSPVWQDNDGDTPVRLAVAGNHPKTTSVLTQFSTVGLNSASGYLAIAASHGSPELLEVLLKAGVDVNHVDGDHSEPIGETALFLAAKMNHLGAVRFLLAHGADPEIREGSYGWTPVFVAAVEGFDAIVAALIDGGADIARTDGSGWTAKEHACLRGHIALADKIEQAAPGHVPDVAVALNTPEARPAIEAALPPPLSLTASKPGRGPAKPVRPTTPATTTTRVRRDDKTDAGVDTIVKTFGHRYLYDKTMVLVTLGSTDLRYPVKPVDLDRVPFSKAHTTQLDTALSLVVSAAPTVDNASSFVDLPLAEGERMDPISFFVDRVDDVKLYFDLVPTYSGSSSSNKKILGRAVAFLPAMYRDFGKQQKLQETYTLPIVEADTMEVLGKVQFGLLVVRPFSHPNMGIEKSTTYWKSLINTRVIGHRGLGKNSTSKKSLQLGENTIESFIQAANLGASYVEFDVQLTKDDVPVIYHDFLVSETGIDIPVHAISLEQFLHISKLQEESHKAVNSSGMGPGGVGHRRRGGSPPPSFGSDTRRPRSVSMHESDSGIKDSSSVGVPAVQENEQMKLRMQYTRDYKAKGFKGNYRGHSIQSSFTTLEQVFKNLPKNVGFNIECKYPMLDESQNEDMDMTGIELNKWVDTVLKCVYDYGDGRDIIFSSFHPDVCLMIALKQPSIPVLFLTEGGADFMADVRASSLQEAIRFARRWDLLGIVSAAKPLIQCPRLVNVVKESGLVCVTYGTDNNDPSNARLQMKSGVDAVIVDSVLAIRKELAHT